MSIEIKSDVVKRTGFYSPSLGVNSFTYWFKIMLLTACVSLVLSMPLVFNLGFGNCKHMFTANSPNPKGILVHAGAQPQKCVGFTAHQQLFALCFLELEIITVNKHLQADKWDSNWLSMEKTWFISVWQAYTDHFVNLGQSSENMLEASRETPERM